MKKLWEKDLSAGKAGYTSDPVIEAFETKDDLIFDQKLVVSDVLASMAHAKMLHKIGILEKKELTQLTSELKEILVLHKEGKFVLKKGDEDVHTKIENFLVRKAGDIGRKIHTGRSRNDQILVALRLFTKEELLGIWEETLSLIESFIAFAKKYEFVPMPGYTHMQKAMPSSVGMWAGNFVESLLDDLIMLKAVYELNDQSPLGSAAGYGVPLKLDRVYTQQLLGFEKLQQNALACQNARGKLEAAIVGALHQILLDISRFAADTLLFTTSEFDFFEVDEQFVTGSSIMPQKKNVDIAELIRSKAAVVLGYMVQIAGIVSGLPSGYNRDLQDTKKPLMESLEMTKQTIHVANLLLKHIKPNEKILETALTEEIFAAHEALALVGKGMPFRKAYQFIASKKPQAKINEVEKILRKSTHIGGTGNLGLQTYQTKLQKEKDLLTSIKKKHHTAIAEVAK